MEMYIKECGKTTSKMEKVWWNIQMEPDMMANGWKEKSMDKEYIIIKMEQNIKADLRWVKNMEMEFLFLLMALELKDFGITII